MPSTRPRMPARVTCISPIRSLRPLRRLAMETRPPLPPFTHETATQKTRMAEDAWNTRDPDRVILVYTEDTRWRNRSEFPVGRDQVREFLKRKWSKELDY